MNPRPFPLFSAFVTIVVACGLTALLLGQAAAPSLTLLSRDGRRAVPLTLVNDQEFVGLDDLAGTFQLAVQESLGAITVSYKGKTIVLTPDQTLASVAGRLISLPAAPVRSGRRWLVPVEFISRALSPIYDVRIDLRKPSRLLVVGDLRVPRVVVRYDATGQTGRLTIDATPRTASTVSQEADRIVVKFEADALDAANPPLPSQPAPTIVQDVRLTDPVTLTVDLTNRFGGFKATSQPVDNTTRLVLDLAVAATTETAPTPPAATPAPPGATPPAPELPPLFGQPTSAIRTIAIDPGHGGEDEGVRGAGGAKEKDINLAIARRAKAVLEARLGMRVLLTREDDRNVPLEGRTAFANNNKVDLFVSIHVNASVRKAAAGATICCAAFDKDAAAAAGAARGDRLPTFGGGVRDIELVPWDLAQTRHLDQSSNFSELLARQLRDRVPMSGHPTDRAPLRVLESANMPAVLVEVGFLSNPDQEKVIAGEGFQSSFVQGLYEAVVRYRDSLQENGTR